MKTKKEIVIKAKAYAESIGNEDGLSAYDYVMGYTQCQEDMADEINRFKVSNRILTDELEDLDKSYTILNEQFVKTKEWNLEIVYSNKFKDKEIEDKHNEIKRLEDLCIEMYQCIEFIPRNLHYEYIKLMELRNVRHNKSK